MAFGDYLQYRRENHDISGSLEVIATTDDTTLVSAKDANHTIFIQRLSFWVSTSVAQTISFEDSDSSAFQIAEIPSAPGKAMFNFDFGARGVALTEGKDFKMMVSAVGYAGALSWEGYQKRTANGAL